MLQKPDDGNTRAFAANMIGYLGLEEYENDLLRLTESRHPSVTSAARRALEMIGTPDNDAEKGFDESVAALRSLGLQITGDPRRIGEVTSEAAYFMFADRKKHGPKVQPLKLPLAGDWLTGKPVFKGKPAPRLPKAFAEFVQRMGYTQLSVYDADVRYGVNSHADFTLYKLGFAPGDPRREAKREVLLGYADYVMTL